MPDLSVNIDHVATLRQARRTYEPDPCRAAALVQLGGAAGVTVHLREDRRHIQDDDLHRLGAKVQCRLNLEIAATDEMVGIACAARPHMAMLVPEGRQEITTEGGLDVAGQMPLLGDVVARLRDAGVPASAFIDAEPDQIEAAAASGFAVCEVHTGPWAAAMHEHGYDGANAAVTEQLQRVADAGSAITAAGMRFNAGHALNYLNVAPIAALPDLHELHIGHSIVSRAVFDGMRASVEEMCRLIQAAATSKDAR